MKKTCVNCNWFKYNPRFNKADCLIIVNKNKDEDLEPCSMFVEKEDKYCEDCCWFANIDDKGYGNCAHYACKAKEQMPIHANYNACNNFVSNEDARHNVAILVQHNRWRKDQNVPPIYHPVDVIELGNAIDFACNFIKTYMEL